MDLLVRKSIAIKDHDSSFIRVVSLFIHFNVTNLLVQYLLPNHLGVFYEQPSLRATAFKQQTKNTTRMGLNLSFAAALHGSSEPRCDAILPIHQLTATRQTARNSSNSNSDSPHFLPPTGADDSQ
ncbi:unknown protein [Seminavis robusta]|uniref:Uncharacterized protein n=1 Tax=Seminavis robusta TaxID=568900 RepID=A0A9N8HKY1_9STRA|nr:unknown protein [Seminavis robusta]|eukprot:Sro645_g180621.1  (125) ;mRNA; f:21201-21575